MTNRLESMTEHTEAKKGGNVISLMGMIKTLVNGADNKLHPGIQTVLAWKTLGRMHQG